MNVKVEINIKQDLLMESVSRAKGVLIRKGVKEEEMIILISESLHRAIINALRHEMPNFVLHKDVNFSEFFLLGLRFKPIEGLPFRDFFIISCKEAEVHPELSQTIHLSSVCEHLTFTYNIL